MSQQVSSHEKLLTGNALKIYGALAVIFALAICLDVGVDWLVAQGYLKRTELVYWLVKAVAVVIEVCDSVAICAVVIRHAYDVLRKVVKEEDS